MASRAPVTLVSVDVGSAKVEIVGDVSRFAGEVARELNSILARMRLQPVEVDGDFKRAEDAASDAADSIEKEFQDGADKSEDALAEVDEDFQEPRQNASQAADQIASDFESAGSRARRALSGAARFMAGAILGVTAAATAAAGAIAAISLTRGFTRLADIEDAQAKLRGLGHEAETVETVMNNALEAVQGTAFGLSESATIAASLVAAGIGPGEDLARTLKAVADTATIAGSDLRDIGTIFTQVATAGRLTGDDLMQLQERGIPVLQFLADQMGITADAAREMVSRGEVDFETFRAALEANIGGAALESGTTTRGAFSNMMAAISRVGANLLSGVFPMFKEVFTGITEFLAPIEDVAKNVGDALGAAFDVIREGGSVGDAFATFRESLNPELFQEITSTIRDLVTNGLQFLSDNAGDIVGILLELRSAIFDAAINMFMGIVDALPEVIPQVISGLVDMLTTLVDTIVGALPRVVAAAGFLVTGLVDGLVTALPQIIQGAVQIVTTLLTGIVELLPIIIGAGLRLIEGIVEGILTALPQIQLAIIEILPQLLTALATMAPDLLLLGVRILTNIVQGIGDSLPTLIDTVQNEVIPTLIRTLQDEGPAMIEAGGAALTEFMQGWLDSVDIITTVITENIIPAITGMFQENPEVIEAGINVLMTLIQAWLDNIEMITDFITDTMIPLMTTVIEENLPALIDAGIQILEAVIQGLIQAMPQINQAIVGQIIPAMFQALITAIPAMNRAGTQLITTLISSLWSTWRTKSGENFNRIKNAITNFFSNAGQWLRDAGRRVIDGLIGGIRSKFDDVRNTLGNLTSMLPDWKGPAELDRRILRDAGRQVMEGFQAGIQDERGNVERLLRGITSDIGSIGVFTGRVQGGDGAGQMRAPFAPQITVNVYGQGREAGEQAAEAILERLAQSVLVR